MIGSGYNSDDEQQDFKEKENLEKLVRLYEKVIYGADDDGGMLGCLDRRYTDYYIGCWERDLKEAEELRKKMCY